MKAVLLLSSLAVLFAAGCTTDVRVPRTQVPSLCATLTDVQQTYLNANDPARKSADVLSDAELQRRLSIVIETWSDYIRGRENANSNDRSKLFACLPLNAYERTYVQLLRSRLQVEVVPTHKPIDDLHRLAYIYGYNGVVGRRLESQNGLNYFVSLIESAVREHTAEKFNYYSPFFIPWLFNNETHIIELDQQGR